MSKKNHKQNAQFSNSNNNLNKKQFHIKVNVIFTINVILLILALTQSLYFLMTSFSVEENKITYKENGNIDYKVYLKDNDFYETDYLEKNMVYVSSLIKNINATFNYDFNIDQKSNIDFEYSIIGKITITDDSGSNLFFEKEYSLINPTKESIKNQKNYNLSKEVVIDYGYYNSLANTFKKSYGVNSKSNFVVTMIVKYNNDNKDINLNKSNQLSLTIPLSESEVNIALDSSKLSNENKEISTDSHIVITSYRKLISSIILGILSLVFFVNIIINLFELKPKRSKYDSLIHKFLREYDRLIVNTTTKPSLENNKIINVETFQELLDVRDNLKEPIKYYVVKEHQKCIFYLNHNNEIYIFKVNADELENQ